MMRKIHGVFTGLFLLCVLLTPAHSFPVGQEETLSLRVESKLKPLYMTPGLKEFFLLLQAQKPFFSALSQNTGISEQLLKALVFAEYHKEAVTRQREREEKIKKKKKSARRKKAARRIPPPYKNENTDPIAFLKDLHTDAFIQARAKKIAARFSALLFALLREDAALLAYVSGKEPVQKFLQTGFHYASLYYDVSALAQDRYLTPEQEHAVYRVLAAQHIVALYDESTENFALLQFVYARFRPEAVWYYVQGLKSYDTVHDIKKAVKQNELVTLDKLPPDAGIAFHKEIGQLLKDAPELRFLYKSAKPETLGFLLYLADVMRENTKNKNFALVMTSMIRDVAYQSALTKVNRYTAKDVSLHTTGYAMDIDRDETLKTDADKKAFRQLLTQLSSQGEIYFKYESNGCAHVCLNPKAAKKYEAYLMKKLTGEGNLTWNTVYSAGQD